MVALNIRYGLHLSYLVALSRGHGETAGAAVWQVVERRGQKRRRRLVLAKVVPDERGRTLHRHRLDHRGQAQDDKPRGGVFHELHEGLDQRVGMRHRVSGADIADGVGVVDLKSVQFNSPISDLGLRLNLQIEMNWGSNEEDCRLSFPIRNSF